MKNEIQEFRELLKTLSPKEGEHCAYCGILATDKEHVVPLSHLKKLEEMKLQGFDVKIPEYKIVPACHECNLIALDKVFDNFKDKKAYIKKELRRKYRKFVNAPDWTDQEIEELEGELKKYVILSEEIKRITKKRLSY